MVGRDIIGQCIFPKIALLRIIVMINLAAQLEDE